MDPEQAPLPLLDIQKWMGEALNEARMGFEDDEIPVGCVFVRWHDGEYRKIIGSHNLTNRHQNASRHCEINCLLQMEATLTK
jgi:tRNA(Arg) A34 adenosine deaminase TadA